LKDRFPPTNVRTTRVVFVVCSWFFKAQIQETIPSSNTIYDPSPHTQIRKTQNQSQNIPKPPLLSQQCTPNIQFIYSASPTIRPWPDRSTSPSENQNSITIYFIKPILMPNLNLSKVHRSSFKRSNSLNCLCKQHENNPPRKKKQLCTNIHSTARSSRVQTPTISKSQRDGRPTFNTSPSM